VKISGWAVTEPGRPLELRNWEAEPGRGEVLVQVAGCGICHTDLGFYYDRVPTRHPLPLVLGHEISGTVVSAGPGSEEWLHRDVVVPAVIPCGGCDACRAGQASICPDQVFPGNDVDGGFATHVVVPSRGLCPIPRGPHPAGGGADLQALCVIADAVTTPYQAILRSGLAEGDLAVFVGAGGVGGFGIQIASSFGARVVAIDVDPRRLEKMRHHGAQVTIDGSAGSFKSIRETIRAFAGDHRIPTWRRKVFEASGTVAGQETAFGLVEPGGWLGIIGYTDAKASVRISNLMALDATARGNWGCPPEHYPAVLDLVLSRRVLVEPFIERRPISGIAEAFADLHARRIAGRVVLVPESRP